MMRHDMYTSRPTVFGKRVGNAMSDFHHTTLQMAGIEDQAKLELEEDYSIIVPRMCIGRPFTSSSGKAIWAPQVVRSIDFGSSPSVPHENEESNEWSILSVADVLGLNDM